MTTGALPPEIDNETRDPACLAAALRYLDLGWSPIIVCPPDHAGTSHQHRAQCSSPGKSPIGRWKQFQTQPAVPTDLHDFWRRCPCGNVGIVTGRVSGIVAIDVDGEPGDETLRDLAGAALPQTIAFSSGRDMGYRLIYSLEGYDGPVPTIPINRFLKILGDGAQTVAPPSRHQNGESYCWQARHAPGETPCVPLPDWLATLLRNHRAPAQAQQRSQPPTVLPSMPTERTDSMPIPKGARSDMLTQLAGSARRFGSPERELFGLLQLANDRCVDDQGRPAPLSQTELGNIARSVAGYQPANATISMILAMSQNRRTPTDTRTMMLRNASTIQARPIDWLWPQWVIHSSIAIIEGMPGVGKSQVTYDILARITTGQPMPFGVPTCFGEPRNVIIANFEDDWEQAIVPRLRAAGADMNRVFDLSGTQQGTNEDTFRPLKFPGPDVAHLEEAIRFTNAAAMAIEPYVATMADGLDINSYNDVYAYMAPLKRVANKHGCTILLSRHQRKDSSGSNAMNRGIGSIGGCGAVRSVAMIDVDPRNREQCILASVKGNMARPPASLGFRIIEADTVSRIEWLGETTLTADDLGVKLTSEQREDVQMESSEQRRAVEFLYEILNDGPRTLRDVTDEAREAQISERTRDRASCEIGVVKMNRNHPDNPTGQYAWRLPTNEERQIRRNS